MKKNKLLLNILFYILLIILIYVLLIPYIYTDRSIFHLPMGLNLNHRNVTLVKGEKIKLSIIGINKRVHFSTTDFKVCDVDLNGWVIARRTGKAIIKATVDNKLRTCKVTVIDISEDNLKLSINETKKVKIEGISSKVTWKSSNKSVATVSSSGKIKGCASGRATITGKVKDKTLTCTVNVK